MQTGRRGYCAWCGWATCEPGNHPQDEAKLARMMATERLARAEDNTVDALLRWVPPVERVGQ